jgi:hypothetical protein
VSVMKMLVVAPPVTMLLDSLSLGPQQGIHMSQFFYHLTFYILRRGLLYLLLCF